jgi:light-regulated signal transduction histidine kinase (bacteriophytochrome)
LTSDNPRQQNQLDQLQPALAQQLAWEEKVIVVRREQGFPVAQQLVSTGAGLRLSDEIGSQMHSMQDVEYGLLLLDRRRAATVATATFLLLPLGVFLSLGILSLGIFFLNAGVTEQAETERALRTSENEVRQLNAELEERVRQRTADLRAANNELEAFSYSVSHDLRAPLRAVDGFSQAVLEDYGPKLPEEGVHYLQTIRKGAQRMGALIDDLLSFSRLSRAALNKQSVDTTRLVRDVVAELNPEKDGRSVDLRVHDLLPSHGDPALLKQVWTNLLSNALKYTRKKEKAVIEVGSRSDNGENLYFVRDNGTGFDMRYAHKLFGVFQRLHRNDEFEGTGVGLAIVQRVVHRHGGRVWAESTPDHGATFHFSLKAESNL